MHIVLRHSKVTQALLSSGHITFSGRGENTREGWTFDIGFHNDCMRNNECRNDNGSQEALLESPEGE